MLLWKELAESNFCHECGICIWITDEDFDNGQHANQTVLEPKKVSLPTGKKIAKKILWHFPIKTRLQRLFMCSKTTALMRWHNEGHIKADKLRHPTDSKA